MSHRSGASVTQVAQTVLRERPLLGVPTRCAAGPGRYGGGMAQQRRKRRRAQRRTGGTWAQLAARCREIDGAGYGAYKQLAGTYRGENGQWQIAVDHVQADPFAAPSKVRVIVPRAELDLAPEFTDSRLDRVAVADALARAVAAGVAGSRTRSVSASLARRSSSAQTFWSRATASSFACLWVCPRAVAGCWVDRRRRCSWTI